MRVGVLSVLVLSVFAATLASAAEGTRGRGGVVGSVHDMNTVMRSVSPDPDARICPYCHTPHHALDEKNSTPDSYLPLWSRTLTDQSYTQYGGDPSTTKVAELGSVNPLIGPTRLCLSCHDGSVAPDQHTGVVRPSKIIIGGRQFTGLDSPSGRPPRYVQGSHPIGFLLAEAVAADRRSNSGLGGFVDGLDASATYLGNPGKTISSQLYQGYMTCATCHDVHNIDDVITVPGIGIDDEHIDTLGRNYLLFSPQSGSQLCLSCHRK